MIDRARRLIELAGRELSGGDVQAGSHAGKHAEEKKSAGK